MSEEVKTKPSNPTEALLVSKRDSLLAVATKGLDVDRLIKQGAIAALESQNLAACTSASLVLSVARVCELGLDLSKALGQAYLIPYGNTCQLIIGYKGLIALAYRSGRVSMIDADQVREGDTFSWTRGTNPTVTHEPAPFGKRGELVGAYCVVYTTDGAKKVEVMDRPEIEAIRSRSRAGSSGPWKTDYARMAIKTVIRRACQQLPLSPELVKAVEYDADDIDPTVKVETPARRTLADRLDKPEPAPSSRQLPSADDDPTDYSDPNDILAGASPNQPEAA